MLSLGNHNKQTSRAYLQSPVAIISKGCPLLPLRGSALFLTLPPPPRHHTQIQFVPFVAPIENLNDICKTDGSF